MRFLRDSAASRDRTPVEWTSAILPHVGFDCGQRLACRRCGADGGRAHSRRDNEGFSKMRGKGMKRVRWALHNRRVAFDKAEHVQVSLCVVRHRSCKPMTARFNKLKRMQ